MALIEEFCFVFFSLSQTELESACNAGDLGLIPGLERSPGEGNSNPHQYSCLENPMDRGACQATVHRVARVGHDLATTERKSELDRMFKQQFVFGILQPPPFSFLLHFPCLPVLRHLFTQYIPSIPCILLVFQVPSPAFFSELSDSPPLFITTVHICTTH